MIPKDYKYLIDDNYFTEEQIFSKLKTIYLMCENHIQIFQPDSKTLYPHEALLEMLVCDYFADLARLKHFHEIEWANPIKQIAYISFWLMRCAPIQIANNNCETLFLNEKLAISLFFTECKERMGGTLTASQNSKLKEFGRELHYYYRYRHYTQQSIEHTLSAFMNGLDFIA
ncbi:MAG: hypothetical protein FWF81_05625 [Defluviitaleaceae bacterium]|nr:hypothetical protein [Defluviitaleaceae bacterium]